MVLAARIKSLIVVVLVP